MLNSELAQLLRTCAARLDGSDAYLAPTIPSPPPRAAPAVAQAPKSDGGACPPGMVRGMCTFWKVDTTSSGRARGRVGVSWRDPSGKRERRRRLRLHARSIRTLSAVITCVSFHGFNSISIGMPTGTGSILCRTFSSKQL